MTERPIFNVFHGVELPLNVHIDSKYKDMEDIPEWEVVGTVSKSNERDVDHRVAVWVEGGS